MNEQELLQYIKERDYKCELCYNLQKAVIKNGLDSIRNYEGFICGAIEDMKIRLMAVDNEKKEKTK
jgi:hypothetical protein